MVKLKENISEIGAKIEQEWYSKFGRDKCSLRNQCVHCCMYCCTIVEFDERGNQVFRMKFKPKEKTKEN